MANDCALGATGFGATSNACAPGESTGAADSLLLLLLLRVGGSVLGWNFGDGFRENGRAIPSHQAPVGILSSFNCGGTSAQHASAAGVLAGAFGSCSGSAARDFGTGHPATASATRAR